MTPNNNGSSFQAGEPSQVHRGPPSNGVRPFIQARNALNGLANKSIRSVSPYICDLEAYGTSKDDSGGVQSEGGIELPDTEEKQNHEFRDSDSTLDKQSVIDSRIDSPIRFIQELPSVKKKLASSLTDLRIGVNVPCRLFRLHFDDSCSSYPAGGRKLGNDRVSRCDLEDPKSRPATVS